MAESESVHWRDWNGFKPLRSAENGFSTDKAFPFILPSFSPGQDRIAHLGSNLVRRNKCFAPLGVGCGASYH